MLCDFGGYPRKSSFALKGGGAGDVSGSILWKSKTTTYVPTPVAHGEHLYWVNDEAEAICMDIATGKVVTKRPVDGIEGTRKRSFYASILLAGDKLIAVSRFNGTFVFEATPTMKQIACNKFDDRSDFSGTPAVSRNALYLRSGRMLYCVGAE